MGTTTTRHRSTARSGLLRPAVALALGGLLVTAAPAATTWAAAPATAVRVGAASTAGRALAAHPVPRAPIRNAVRIVTTGMNYRVRGALHPGNAAITWVNRDDESHMMAMARLKTGVTLAALKAALAVGESATTELFADSPDKAWGNPALLGPGWATTVTMTGLKKGRYALICFLTDAMGRPHWQMGMVDLLTVRGARRAARPASIGTIRLTDKAIRLPRHFTGQGTYRVVNTGRATHALSFARLSKGTSLAAYFGHVGMAMSSGGSIDGGGGVLIGGIDVLAPGRTGWVTLRLPRGRYGYLSPQDVAGPGLPPQHGVVRIR